MSNNKNKYNNPFPPTTKDVSPEILHALRNGDHRAFQEIYLHYATPIKEFLTVLTRSEEDAREITQEIFVAIWEKHDQIDPQKSIKGYLYTIARNSALKLFERQKVRDKYVQANADASDDSIASDELMIAEETRLLIEIAISRMPAQRKKIFELNRNEGLKSSEIAEKLNLSRHTVDNHLAAAKKDIKEIIAAFIVMILLHP